jgi:hypothetical protein
MFKFISELLISEDIKISNFINKLDDPIDSLENVNSFIIYIAYKKEFEKHHIKFGGTHDINKIFKQYELDSYKIIKASPYISTVSGINLQKKLNIRTDNFTIEIKTLDQLKNILSEFEYSEYLKTEEGKIRDKIESDLYYSRIEIEEIYSKRDRKIMKIQQQANKKIKILKSKLNKLELDMLNLKN